MSPAAARNLILTTNPEILVDKLILASEAPHFPAELLNNVLEQVADRFGVSRPDVQLVVVGSAKLGFAMFSKARMGEAPLPALRPFGIDSDIDLAIVSRVLFERIWDELGAHALAQPSSPWDSGRLGDYLVTGWLRPDHFPRHPTLRRCDDWWKLFSALSSDTRFGRRKIRGALYFSHDRLRRYQLRSVTHCRRQLEVSIT